MEVAVYLTVAIALGLVVARPRIGSRFRLSPAVAAGLGVAVLLLLKAVGTEDILIAGANLWRPFVAIASIMIMTDVAQRIGLLDVWASHVEARARSTSHLFRLVFGLGVLTSATLNNDAAILLLTPLVVALIRRHYPDRPRLIVPFAFAVFMSAGVAALPVSNPMNMVVSEMAGIDFNTYALHMLPVAIVCWLLSFGLLRWLFREYLRDEEPFAIDHEPKPTSSAQKGMMLLLGLVLLSYPVIGSFGGPVWLVAFGGALLALFLFGGAAVGGVRAVLRHGVSWDTLGFLAAVLIMSMGLKQVGLVDHLASLYEETGIATVGSISALGSAVLNNHPMSHLNMMALAEAKSPSVYTLAALVGGDLGPRLLPIGSLAGLLWLALLRRQHVQISLQRFVLIGVIVTLPCLAAALLVLAGMAHLLA